MHNENIVIEYYANVTTNKW